MQAKDRHATLETQAATARQRNQRRLVLVYAGSSNAEAQPPGATS